MAAAQEAEVAADIALKTARDQANAAEWAFHNVILGSKDQVAARNTAKTPMSTTPSA